MYQVDDLVMYRNIGVCRIEEIAYREQFGVSGQYYILKPIDDDALSFTAGRSESFGGAY